MPKYLTPQMYRTYDPGVLTPEVTDLQLANWIQGAEADIDSFVGFNIQGGGFEQRRSWTQSEWNQQTLRTRVPNWPVPAQNIYGYKIQVSNVTTAGSGFFAVINPGDVVINVFGAYVEIVPLQAVTYALSPVILQLGLKPPLVQLEYQAGFYISTLAGTMYNKGDNLTYIAQDGFWATTYNQALHIQPILLPPIPPVIYANGIVIAASNYSINATEGTVTFNVARPASDVITADYTYTIPHNVKQATISRTTWLLGQRQLAKTGLVGLEVASGGEQRAQRVRSSQRVGVHAPSVLELLDAETVNKLIEYTQIGVG